MILKSSSLPAPSVPVASHLIQLASCALYLSPNDPGLKWQWILLLDFLPLMVKPPTHHCWLFLQSYVLYPSAQITYSFRNIRPPQDIVSDRGPQVSSQVWKPSVKPWMQWPATCPQRLHPFMTGFDKISLFLIPGSPGSARSSQTCPPVSLHVCQPECSPVSLPASSTRFWFISSLDFAHHSTSQVVTFTIKLTKTVSVSASAFGSLVYGTKCNISSLIAKTVSNYLAFHTCW